MTPPELQAQIRAELDRTIVRLKFGGALEQRFRDHLRADKRPSRALFYLIPTFLFIAGRLFGTRLFHTPDAILGLFRVLEYVLVPVCALAACIDYLKVSVRVSGAIHVAAIITLWSSVLAMRTLSALHGFYFPPAILGVTMIGAAVLCGFNWQRMQVGIVLFTLAAIISERQLQQLQPVFLMNAMVDFLLATLAIAGAYFNEGLYRRVWLQAQMTEILAHTDALTGLLTRGAFNRRFAQLFAQARREQKNLAVMLIDVDHFKAINDTYGHLYGDQVLHALGTAIARAPAKRPFDIRARYGGEELLVAWYDIDVAALPRLIEQTFAEVRALVLAPPSATAAPPQATISAGIAYLTPDGSHRAEELLRKADALLYKAKRDGRNRYYLEAL